MTTQLVATLTPAERIARVAAQTRLDGLSPELRSDVSRRLLDLLGNSIAAIDQAPAVSIAELVAEWGGAAQADGLGLPMKVPARSAALLGGTLAHCLDFDDTHLPSVLHPSASVIPAALAAAQSAAATGAQFLDAACMGIEIVCRLGMAGYDRALGNSVFFERGQHATAICGTIGSAVAAGMLLGLTEDQLASAIGIAASMGSGILEANRTGGTVKRIHCGWAAHAGVTAAEMARAGISGPPTVLEGRFGFFEAFVGDSFDIREVVDGLGESWLVPGIFFKPYPCNHFTQAGIDAALRMRAAGIRPDQIESLTLAVPTPVLRTIAEPAAEKARPRSGYHAAFSGPYTVAAALIGGGGLGVFHEDFTDEAAADPERLALAAKVTCEPSGECDAIFPEQFPAILTARLSDGRTVVEKVLANRGGPANPLSTAEHTAKFTANTAGRIGDDAAERLAALILSVDRAASLDGVMDSIGRALGRRAGAPRL